MAIPFVTIELDKTYQIRFDLKSMIEFEQTTGKYVIDKDYTVETTMQKTVDNA